MTIAEEGVYMPVSIKHFCLMEESSILLDIIPVIEAFSLIKVWQLTFML